MLGNPSGGTSINSDDLDDYMIQLEYENPESDLELGVFFLLRHGGDQASDAPPAGTPNSLSPLGNPNAANNATTVNTKVVNVYALRDSEHLRLGFEASFMSGEAGVLSNNGDKVEWGGFGIAGELEYRPPESKWKWGLKAGTATGDDPSAPAKFGGYVFNRNYDVAMLLFNHPLGQGDFLRTGLYTNSPYQTGTKNINVADVEAISNAIYLAPIAKYAINDHWSVDNSLITGWLNTAPMPKQQHMDLGYEWDATVIYSPRKGIAWVNQFGILFPGGAWNGDGSVDANGNPVYSSGLAYGFGTKAAISF